MPDARPPLDAYRFGPFRLSVPGRILERNGERIQLTPKAIDTLLFLVENAGQVITKEALIKAVWPDVTVVESGLTRNISALRKALEEGREEESFIETIPRRGYRFIAEVTEELRADNQQQPKDTTKSQPPPQPVEPVRQSPRRTTVRSGAWFAAWIGACAAAIASLAGLYTFLQPERSPTRAAVEPFVRIGEHLLYKLAPEETIRAAEHFERAIAGNPGSAGAHAGLSIALLQLSMFGIQPLAEVLPRAEAASRKAVDLDGNSGPAHYAVAMVRMTKDWAFRAADAEFRLALQLDPDSVQTRLGYARLKLTTGDSAGALRLVEEALRLDPASPPLGVEYCRVFYFRRDFRRAESECRKVLDRESGYALAHYYLALSLGFLGRFEEAHANLDRSGLMPGVLDADRAWLHLRAGDKRPALAVLEKRRELLHQGKVDASAKLLLAAILDRTGEAYEALEAGLTARAPELLTVHLEPRLDSVRNDPRYPTVLRRIGIVNP